MATALHVLASPGDTDLHRYGGEALLRDGQPKAALTDFEEYLAHQALAADSAQWVSFLRLGGWAYLDAGRPKEALPLLERALRLSAAHPFYPGWVPRLRYQLAKALVATHGDVVRAEGLARTAHDELQGVDGARDLLVEVDAWRGRAFEQR